MTCALGVHMVGYLMLCLSGMSAVFAYFMGKFQKYIGRFVLLISGEWMRWLLFCPYIG